MSLLISFLVFAIILVALWYISTLLPQPMQKVAQVIIVVIGLVWLALRIPAIVGLAS